MLYIFAFVFLWEAAAAVRLGIPLWDAVRGGLPGGGETLRWFFSIGAIVALPSEGLADARMLATALFAHFGLAHLAFNGLAMWILGRTLEEMDGPAALFLAFFLCGLAANATSLAWHVGIVGRNLFQVGASGAICGFIGILHHRAGRFAAGKILQKQLFQWMVWIVFFGFLVQGDNAAHVGGFVAGIVVDRMLLATRGRVRLQAALAGILALAPLSYWTLAAKELFF